MRYTQYRNYSAMVQRLNEDRACLLWDLEQAKAEDDTFAVAQYSNIKRGLDNMIALMVSELSLEELTNDDIQPEDYQFANCKHSLFDYTPATFWEYLERKEEVLQRLAEGTLRRG